MASSLGRREFMKTASVAGVVAIQTALKPVEASQPEGSTTTRRVSTPARITLLQINDSHGYLDLHQEWFPGADGKAEYRTAGGYARIAALVKRIGQETAGRVLVFDNGDTFHGTYPIMKTRGQAAVPILNSLGLHAMTAHWDFSFGPARLKELASQLNYPILAINIYDKKIGKRFFEPYKVLHASGLKIGLIGIASNIVGDMMPASYGDGLRFTSGRDELPGMIKEVREKARVDLVVVLSHLGFPQDMKLLSEVQGVDVLLSGHTHDRLYRPVRQGGALVIQSGCQGSFLGRLDLEIQNGKVTAHHHELIEVAETIRPDSATEALVRQTVAPFAADLETVVGEVADGLDRNTCLESTMDNFLLDAVREAAGTELALCNGWRWGAPIRPGKVTLNDLYNIVPMTVPISTVELSGAELMELLEDNLEATFATEAFRQRGGYVKRSVGLTAYIRSQNPPGTRLTRLLVGTKEVQADKLYSAAFLSPVAVPEKYNRNRRDLPDHPVDAMRTYLKTHDPARTKIRGSVIAF
jgi:sulfur-oxidizing protein SoxB